MMINLDADMIQILGEAGYILTDKQLTDKARRLVFNYLKEHGPKTVDQIKKILDMDLSLLLVVLNDLEDADKVTSAGSMPPGELYGWVPPQPFTNR